MRQTVRRKLVAAAGLFLWVTAVRLLSGCSITGVGNENPDKIRDLEFTVIGDGDVPEELLKMIQEKKQDAFKLTYSDDQSLYIVSGYGVQETGGYSITVEQLYLSENTIVFDTELMGPAKGEMGNSGPSCPYIVVKTEYLEEPVIFQ